MKFEVKITYFSTEESRAAEMGDPYDIIEMEGDLDSVKTYLKLAAGDNFNWGAVSVMDKVTTGEVDRWMVQKDRTTGQLALHAFSFYDVEHEININALHAIFDPDINSQPMNKLLGGGNF